MSPSKINSEMQIFNDEDLKKLTATIANVTF